MKLLACTAAIFLAVAIVGAQNPTMLGHPDDYSRVDIEHGALVYAEHCDRCHGANGNGVSGVDLRSGKFRKEDVSDGLSNTFLIGERCALMTQTPWAGALNFAAVVTTPAPSAATDSSSTTVPSSSSNSETSTWSGWSTSVRARNSRSSFRRGSPSP